MPPRISLLLPRRLPVRPAQIVCPKSPPPLHTRYASNASKSQDQSNPRITPSGGNESQLPHVTEEQAAMDKIMHETPLQTEEHGSPIQEILKRDKEAQKHAPEVLKQDVKKPGSGQSRSYTTSARRMTSEVQSTNQDTAIPTSMLVAAGEPIPVRFSDTRAVGLEYPDAGPGHKFPLPDMEQWQVTNHLRRRYDPVVDQFTKMIMRDGKLARAQKNMEHILNTLRTTPSPPVTASRPLLTDTSIATKRVSAPAVPRSQLPLSPIQFLTSVIDSVAPLLKIRQQSGLLGGGQNLPIPVPLRVKQRRRTAIKWILDSSEKRTDAKMADRVAREILAVAKGDSGVWEKRALLHRQGVTARSNVRNQGMMRRGGIKVPRGVIR